MTMNDAEEMMLISLARSRSHGSDNSIDRHSDCSNEEQLLDHPTTHGYNEYNEAQNTFQMRSRFSRSHGRAHRSSSMQHVLSSSGSPHRMERRSSMSEAEQEERRKSIQAIMADESLTDAQRRNSIQSLMDGRRRSSIGSTTISLAGTNDNISVKSSQTTLSGYKKNCHPYTSTTTPVPAVAAQDPNLHLNLHENATQLSRRAELCRPVCEHYNRNCTIISPCCGAAFGCRICHDECPVLPPKITKDDAPTPSGADSTTATTPPRRYARSSSMPMSTENCEAPQHHKIDRHAIAEVICRSCFTRQSSKTNNCTNCGIQFGEYHCAICNLWMDAAERPYHCADCGFCRVGGAENFRHCHDCEVCIDAKLFAQHSCKAGKYQQNCPICQEDLFSSRTASHEMPCGHAIHWHCFRDLAAHDSRCPICKKTVESHERMQPTWNAMALSIKRQPMPPNLAKVVTIICNDCEQTDKDRAWHFLGVQCRSCSSFNTVVDHITLVGEEAHDFLMTIGPDDSNHRSAHRRGSASPTMQGHTSSTRSAPQESQRRAPRRGSASPTMISSTSNPALDSTMHGVPEESEYEYGLGEADNQERLIQEQQEHRAMRQSQIRLADELLDQMRGNQRESARRRIRRRSTMGF